MDNITSPPQANAEVLVNQNFTSVKPMNVYAMRQSTTSGLTFGYWGGIWGGITIANGTLALSGSATNYVVVNRVTGAVSVTTSTTNWDALTSFARVARIICGVSTITTLEDWRAGPGGTHGQSSGAQSTPLITVSGTNKNFAATDRNTYNRFTNAAAKTASFNSADSFTAPDEFHIANRAASGNITITPTGITMNAPKGGTLVLEPGDSVTIKFISATEADVIGSTEPL